MLKRVLVVGGAGYIGGAVTNTLLDRKIPFSVYDNLTYEQQYLKPVEFIFGDIRNTEKLKKILKKYSHVIWLAALVGDGACAIKPELTKTINQDSLEWLSKNYEGRIIFTSTCSVYGANPDPVTEESPTKPLSVYAKTKLGAEGFLKEKNALIFRLGTAFGIADTYSRTRMDLAINYMTMN
ncbi:MAG TPA: SDR family oxidoreductase, partial [Candidatus Eisenbacteria bacterium]|nr:SDR family oxidoreductase [Candidatus Eisenbacteria bacterium]